jgi:hypothetical protein
LLDSDRPATEVAKLVGCNVSTVKARRGPRRGPRASGTAKPVSDQVERIAAAIRVAHAQTLICTMPTVDILLDLVERFGVSDLEARDDLATARAQLMADSVAERPAVRAQATAQLKSIAGEARRSGQHAAAVAAWREIGKLHGAYEPDKVQLVPHEAIELGAIIRILDDVGKAALDVLLEQIDRAKAAGRLPVAPPLALPPGPIYDATPRAADPVDDDDDGHVNGHSNGRNEN